MSAMRRKHYDFLRAARRLPATMADLCSNGYTDTSLLLESSCCHVARRCSLALPPWGGVARRRVACGALNFSDWAGRKPFRSPLRRRGAARDDVLAPREHAVNPWVQFCRFSHMQNTMYIFLRSRFALMKAI